MRDTRILQRSINLHLGIGGLHGKGLYIRAGLLNQAPFKIAMRFT
jgi:hypothetical protein